MSTKPTQTKVQKVVNKCMNLFKKDAHIIALKYAKKHPEGFTLGELCAESKMPEENCKKMRSEFIHSGVFNQLAEQRDDQWGAQQNTYILSFNGRSQLLAEEMTVLTRSVYFLTFLMVIMVWFQVQLAKQQLDFIQIQGASDIIEQEIIRNNAIEFCRANPKAQDSGLRYITGKHSGKAAPCSVVIEQYKIK